jgi:hypothetical protein
MASTESFDITRVSTLTRESLLGFDRDESGFVVENRFEAPKLSFATGTAGMVSVIVKMGLKCSPCPNLARTENVNMSKNAMAAIRGPIFTLNLRSLLMFTKAKIGSSMGN